MPKEGNKSSIALTNRPAGEYNLKDKGRKQNSSHLCFFFNKSSLNWLVIDIFVLRFDVT